MNPPPKRDEPLEMSAQEQRELEAFADELRGVWPDPPLPDGFIARLAERRPPRWSLRHALRRDPLLRAASLLLLAVGASAPALAVMHLAGVFRSGPPVVQVETIAEMPEADREDWQPDVLEPDTPALHELLSENWTVALERENRFAIASLDWNRRFGGLVLAESELVSRPALHEALGGMGIRLGWDEIPSEPFTDSWDTANPRLLWTELQRRLARNQPPDPEGALVARVRTLWREYQGDPERGWLTAWIGLLDGPEAAPGPDLPVSQGDEEFWRTVEWRPDVLMSGRPGPR